MSGATMTDTVPEDVRKLAREANDRPRLEDDEPLVSLVPKDAEEYVLAAIADAIRTALASAQGEPVADDKVEYRYDPIAGKMRYYGSSAPNGFMPDATAHAHQIAAGCIADAVLDWLVIRGCIDAGNEYTASEVIEHLDAMMEDELPATVKPVDVDAIRIAEALEACDWSNTPIGNKAIIRAAIRSLKGDSDNG